MAIQPRRITCEVCKVSAVEKGPGYGWPGWGALQGVSLDGVPDPTLCPACKAKLATYLDHLKHGRGED